MTIYHVGTLPESQGNKYREMLTRTGLNIATSAVSGVMAGETALKKQAADLAAKREDTEKKALNNMAQFLSDKYIDVNTGDRSGLRAHLESEHGKIFMKNYLKYHPEYSELANEVDAMPIPSWEAAGNQLEQGLNSIKSKVLKGGVGSLSPNEKQFLEIEKFGLPPDEIGKAFGDMMKADPWEVQNLLSSGDPKDMEKLQEMLKNSIKIRKTLSGRKSPVGEGIGRDISGVGSNDPLGILGGR